MTSGIIHRRALSRPAFTLAEVLVTVGVMGLVLGAMGSIVVLASRAAPDRAATGALAETTPSALDRLAAELPFATALVECAGGVLEFRVPDRTGDGAEETIRYQWTGPAGAALQRRMNGSAWERVSGPLDAAAFSPEVLERTTVRAGTPVLAAERLLASASPTLVTSTSTDGEEVVRQFVPITAAPGALAWMPTRLKLRLASDKASSSAGGLHLGPLGTQLTGSGSNDNASIEVRSAESPPTGAGVIIGGVNIRVATLTKATPGPWVDLPLPGTSYLGPTQGIAIRAYMSDGGGKLFVGYGAVVLAPGRLDTANKPSGPWANVAGQSMAYEVYGRELMPTTVSETTKLLRSVRVSLTPAKAASASHATLALRNEVPAP